MLGLGQRVALEFVGTALLLRPSSDHSHVLNVKGESYGYASAKKVAHFLNDRETREEFDQP